MLLTWDIYHFISLGERKCANILKTHIATGCDWISKLGTNNKALNHEYLLDEFGENSLSDRSVCQAEEYLCLVLSEKHLMNIEEISWSK